jgi:phage-related protein
MSLMGAGREYVLKIIADVTDATKGVEDVANKTSSMKDKMVGVGKAVATGLAATAVIDFGKDCINAAADADDAMDAISAAFGTSSDEIAKFSKSSADNMGISSAAYQEMAAKTGNLLQSMGVNSDDAAKSTEELSKRAADLAAIWGTDTPTAMEAINKGLAGSTKSLQQFGVKIDANEISARAMADGYVDAEGKVTDAGKAIAAQQIIMEKTANVQGAWADNSKDLGSQQDILKAKMANLQATLGEKLLPIIVKLMSFAAPIMNFLSTNAGWLAPLAGVILGIVAALKVWTIVQTALNIVLDANPIGLIVLAIAGLVAGIVLLYTKVDWFRDFVDAAMKDIVGFFQGFWDIVTDIFNWIVDNWPLLLAIITGPIGLAVKFIVDHWDMIKDSFKAAIDFIKQIAGTLWDLLTYPFRKAIDGVKVIIDEIPAAFRTAVVAVTTALSTVWDIISAPFKKGWQLASDAGHAVIDWFGTIKDGITKVFNGLADVIKAPFKLAFDAIKSLWNNTVGGFGFSVPSWVPGIGGKGWSIPKMALGGIVTRPTIALIGDNRAGEAVIPLDKLSSMVGPGVAAGNTFIINVYALDATAAVGKRVYDSLMDYARVSGQQLVLN